MVYKNPQTLTIQNITPSPQFSFPKVCFLFPYFHSQPLPQPSSTPSSHSSQELRTGNKLLPLVILLGSSQEPMSEQQPWLWNGSISLMNDWGSATISSPADSPKCTHSPAGKEKARKGHQRALDKHKGQGQSERSKASLPGEFTPSPDRRATTHFPHQRNPFREWASWRGKVWIQNFPQC